MLSDRHHDLGVLAEYGVQYQPANTSVAILEWVDLHELQTVLGGEGERVQETGFPCIVNVAVEILDEFLHLSRDEGRTGEHGVPSGYRCGAVPSRVCCGRCLVAVMACDRNALAQYLVHFLNKPFCHGLVLGDYGVDQILEGFGVLHDFSSTSYRMLAAPILGTRGHKVIKLCPILWRVLVKHVLDMLVSKYALAEADGLIYILTCSLDEVGAQDHMAHLVREPFIDNVLLLVIHVDGLDAR